MINYVVLVSIGYAYRWYANVVCFSGLGWRKIKGGGNIVFIEEGFVNKMDGNK